MCSKTQEASKYKATVRERRPGLWTPVTLTGNSDIVLKIVARNRCFREKEATMQAAVTLTTLMGGEVSRCEPSTEQQTEQRTSITYSYILLEIMDRISKLLVKCPSFDNVMDFLKFMRHFVLHARELESFPLALPSDPSSPSILDCEDDNGAIYRDGSTWNPPYYKPSLLLKEAAREFLRVPKLNIAGSINTKRLVMVNKEMGVVNLNAADKFKSEYNVPNQKILVRGKRLPKCAIMRHNGKYFGTYRRVDNTNLVLLKHNNKFDMAATYEVW